MKFGTKSVRLLKRNLLVSLYIINKHLKTKIKFYEGKINTNFHEDKVPKEGSRYICLSVILIDSVFRTIIFKCF